jgi:transposase
VLSLPPSVRVFVCLVPVDMRWSFDGLAAAAEQVMSQDPLSGHLFVFHGRRGDRVKILYWDRDGYALWYKRLEAGVFGFPSDAEAAKEITAADLGLILEGIDLRSVKRHKRFALARAACNFLV